MREYIGVELPAASRGWTLGFCAAVELLAFSNAIQDPSGRAWSVVAALVTLITAVGLALRTQRLGYFFLMSLLSSGLVSLCWSLAENRSNASRRRSELRRLQFGQLLPRLCLHLVH